jgi:predicted nuclease with TOPRIM domain
MADQSRSSTNSSAARLKTIGRNAFLASLGFYGKAFDEVQEQFNNLQQQLEERRKMADDIYQELVERGRKVEKDARGVIDEIELPEIELDSLTDRKRLDKQLARARARFKELKESTSLKGNA